MIKILSLIFALCTSQLFAQFEITNVSFTVDTENVLRYSASCETSAPARTYVEWQRILNDGTIESEHSWISEEGLTHSFFLVGFVENAIYQFRIVAWNASACVNTDWQNVLVAAAPPEVANMVYLINNNPQLSGYYLTNTTQVPEKVFQIYNRQGEVLWYDYHSGALGLGLQAVCQHYQVTDENEILTTECHAIWHRNLQGTTLAYFDYNGTEWDSYSFHHAIIINAAGNYVVPAMRVETFDLSANGGSATQQIVVEYLFEINPMGEVIWIWDSKPHFDYLTAQNNNTSYVNYFGSAWNWLHNNAVWQDADGNYLISLKEYNQIAKVEASSGTVLWRIGGANATIAFQDGTVTADQHDINTTPQGNYIVYDNGGLGAQSRVLEFAIDFYDDLPVAVKTFEYIMPDSLYALRLGSARRFENGNRLGVAGFQKNIVEVNAEGQVQWIMEQNTNTYRGFFMENIYNHGVPFDITIAAVVNQCSNWLGVDLVGQPEGGYWFGPGVNSSESFFESSTVGVGQHTVYYKYGWQTDSLVINVLSPSVDTYQNAHICEGSSIMLGGELQTDAGIYYDLYFNESGCDSTIVTNLEVTNPGMPDITETFSQSAECAVWESSIAGDSYIWTLNGTTYTDLNQAIYPHNITGENVVTGKVVVVINECQSEESEEFSSTCVGVIEHDEIILQLIPNPTHDYFILQGLKGNLELLHIEILNTIGQVVKIVDGQNTCEISSLAPGLYSVVVAVPNQPKQAINLLVN